MPEVPPGPKIIKIQNIPGFEDRSANGEHDDVSEKFSRAGKLQEITHAALVGKVEAFSREHKLNAGQGLDFSSGHFYVDGRIDPTVNPESPEAKIIHFVQTRVEADAFKNETSELLAWINGLKEMYRIIGPALIVPIAFFVLTSNSETANPIDTLPIFALLAMPTLVLELYYKKLKKDSKNASPELLQAWEKLRDELENQIKIVDKS